MSTSLAIRHYAAAAALLLMICAPLAAHNGAMAVVVPIEGITIDGDFSDWPEGLERYAVEDRKIGRPKAQDASDLQASFRIGFNEAENALYLAIEVDDESVVVEGPESYDLDGCGIVVGLEHGGDGDLPLFVFRLMGKERFPPMQWDHAEMVAERGEHGHRYEWRLDVGALSGGEVQLSAGGTLSCFLGLDDFDDGEEERASLSWGHGGKMAGAANYGDLMLVNEQDSDMGAITGQVKSAKKGGPYADLSLQFLHDDAAVTGARTDADGHYEVRLPPGEYVIKPGRGEGVEPFTLDRVKVEAGKNRQFNFEVTPSPLLARLSFWVPPERKQEFEGFYEAAVAPLLRDRGWVASTGVAPAAVDSVFSRLFELKSVDAWRDRIVPLQTDEEMNALLPRLGEEFGTFKTLSPDEVPDKATMAGLRDFGWAFGFVPPDGRVRTEFELYSVPVGDGLLVRAGAGRITEVTSASDQIAGEEGPFADYVGRFKVSTQSSLILSGEDGKLLFRWDGPGQLPREMVSVEEDRFHVEPIDWDFTAERDGSGRVSHFIISKKGRPPTRAARVEDEPARRPGLTGTGRRTKAGGGRRSGEWFTLDVADGLPSNVVYGSLEDRDGNLWFATESGVTRYDGEYFTSFTTNDGLVSNWVNTVFEDSKGDLWFGAGSFKAPGGVTEADGLGRRWADALPHQADTATSKDHRRRGIQTLWRSRQPATAEFAAARRLRVRWPEFQDPPRRALVSLPASGPP